jgi:hypothetical protein
MYSGSTCEGEVQSVAGIANGQCLPVTGFGGEGVMMDCRSNGDVVINVYTSQDCEGYVAITHHHLSSLIITRHHSSSLIITHHHSSH